MLAILEIRLQQTRSKMDGPLEACTCEEQCAVIHLLASEGEKLADISSQNEKAVRGHMCVLSRYMNGT